MSENADATKTASKVAATYLDVQVPLSPFLTETRIERINAGRYEGQEIDGALALIKSDDRVLELGAGLGIVGAVIAKSVRPEAMMSFEANPNLVPHILELYEINGISEHIELRNQVLLASSNRPAEVDFYLGNSYLGSSLAQQAARKQHKIKVETEDFDQVRVQFNPTVLVMDIEGGELDFLEDANLTGIRAVVIEFHPGIYGIRGLRRCKSILREYGFERVDAHSNRTVWACQRTDTTRLRVSKRVDGEQRPPTPGSPGSTPMQRLHNAQIVPATDRSFVQHAGVFESSGAYCPQAALWRKGRPITRCPTAVPETEQTISGRWLWGGVLWDHFGHFIVESTSRLWALPQLVDEIDGIVFIPKRPKRDCELLSFQREFIDQLAPDVRVEIAQVPTQVEHLIVPEQGFGLGQISTGSAAFRTAIIQHFARDIAPGGSKKLYISRSRINLKRGGIVAEKILEARLSEVGYDIFHPEQHDIPTQIARYKAAETVISCEGSALHLFGMTARADQQVGIVLRRNSKATNLIVRHLKGFTGIEPSTFNAVKCNWAPSNSSKQHKWVGELDLAQLQNMLEKEGFIDAGGVTWASPSKEDVRAELGRTFKAIKP